MGRRRQAREYALQMLFQIDLAGETPTAVGPEFWRGQKVSSESKEFADRLVAGVRDQRLELDRWIVGSARNWRVERMATVDRNVLRLAVFEMLHDDDTPPAVVIDEAVEVAKKFGSADSGGFINGILDAIRRRLEQRPDPAGTTAGGLSDRAESPSG